MEIKNKFVKVINNMLVLNKVEVCG